MLVVVTGVCVIFVGFPGLGITCVGLLFGGNCCEDRMVFDVCVKVGKDGDEITLGWDCCAVVSGIELGAWEYEFPYG